MGIRSNQSKLAKAIFLDRDGTIIRHVELMRRVSDIKILPHAAESIKKLNKLGFLVIVVTNQPVVARGLAVPKEIDAIHAVLISQFKKKGAKIDAVYFCPHHPNADVKKYRLGCRCRKPEPGMLLKALKKYKIDPERSYMIGDAMIDVVAGKRAGLKTILVKTGPGHALDDNYKHIKPDFMIMSLGKSINIIKNGK